MGNPQGLLGDWLIGLGFMPPAPRREDGTPKGEGFYGRLPAQDEKYASELSIGVNMDGQEILIPSIVPGLSAQQLGGLLSGWPMTDDVVQRAVENARLRMLLGASPFAGPGEQAPHKIPIPLRRR